MGARESECRGGWGHGRVSAGEGGAWESECRGGGALGTGEHLGRGDRGKRQ